MTKLIDLTIDLGALLVPDTGDAEDAVSKYNDLLVGLYELAGLDWIEACVAYDMGCYVDIINERIIQTFDEHEIKISDPETLFRSTVEFLYRLPKFHSHHDILVDADSVSTDPNVFALAIDKDHQSNMKECVASIAVLNKIYSDDVPRNIMLLGCAPAPLIEVTSDIVCVSSDTHDTSSVSQPGEIKSVVQVCDDEVGFMKHMDSIDAEGILLNADTVDDIQLAIRVALFKNDPKMKDIDGWNSIPAPNIGDHFPAECNKILKSAKVGTCAHLLKALVEIASGELRGTYDIRDVRSVGDLVPRRMRVGGSHRLNFWQGPRSKIEIAWFSEKQKSEKTPYIPPPTVLR